MYRLVSVNVPTAHPSGLKTPIRPDGVLMDTLLRAHQNVDVVVTVDNDPALKLLQLDSSQRFDINPYATVQSYLTENVGQLTLTDIPQYAYANYLRYSDAYQAGYDITPVARGMSPDIVLNDDKMIDLLMTKDGIDYNLFNQSCLVSVNGYFMYCQANAQGVYVVDGGKSRLKMGNNLVGIHSFADLGQIQRIPITPAMVSPQGPGYNLIDGAYINTGVDLSQSTVMLVLGGYLNALDPLMYEVVGPQTIKVHLRRYPIFDRLFESWDRIDYTPLNLDKTPVNPTQVSVSQVQSDPVLMAYLTLSSSFLVVLNQTQVFKYRSQTQRISLPDCYTSYVDPRYPLVTGFGKVTEYWSSLEQDRWALKVWPEKYLHQSYNTLSLDQQISVDGTQDSYNQWEVSPAFLQMIGIQRTQLPATA